MKRPQTLFLIFALLISTNVSYAVSSPTFTTGKDWDEKMTLSEKVMAIFKPFGLFRHYGVPLQKTAVEYVEKMDKVILTNPYLQDEDVANIFASTVYTYEPETRQTLEALEIEFLKMKVKDSDILHPRLVIKEAEEENS